MNARYQSTRALSAQAATLTSFDSLKNLLDFAKAAKALMVEAKDDDWVIREADGLAGIALEGILKSANAKTDDLILYFHQIGSSAVRYATLNTWRSRVASLSTKEALTELLRFLRFAAEDSATGFEPYVAGTAKGAIDDIYSRLFSSFELTPDEIRQALSEMSSEDAIQNILIGFGKKAEALDATRTAELAAISKVLDVAAVVLAKRSDSVKMRLSGVREGVNGKLAQSPSLSTDEKTAYFHKLTGAEPRRTTLEGASKLTAQMSSKPALFELQRFFQFAAADSTSFESWLPNMAKNYSDGVAQKLLTGFELSPTEIRALFKSIYGDQTYSDVLVTFTAKAAQMSEADFGLPRMAQFFEIAVAESKGREAWVTSRAQGGLDTCASKLTLSQTTTIDEKITYFHKIGSADERRQALELFSGRVDSIADKSILFAFNRFFLFAASDSAKYEAWLPAIARRGADRISTRLLTSFDLTLDEAKEYFHQIAADQTRRDTLMALRARYKDENRKEVLADLNRLFLYAAEDSAKFPGWVISEAVAASDNIAERLITGFELTMEEAAQYFHQIKGDQVAFNILVSLNRKAERNRDDHEILSYLAKIFEIAAKDTTPHEGYVRSRALMGADYVGSRIIRKTDVDSDEMIRYYGTLSSDQTRKDVLNFWRARLKRSYNDKYSLLALARFFYAAQLNSLHVGSDTGVVNTAVFGASEVTEKLSKLFPVFEGSYEISATCPVGCDGDFINTLTLMNIQGNDGFQAILYNHKTGTVAFSFTNLTISQGGTAFDGFNTFGNLSKLHLDLDQATGDINGWIENSDRVGMIRVTGTLLRSPVQAYDEQARQLSENAMRAPKTFADSVFHGVYGGKPATLKIRNLSITSEPNYAASLTFDFAPMLKISYQSGSYNPKNGMLTLIGAQESGLRLKLALGARVNESGQVELSGVAFNSLVRDFSEIIMTAE